MQVNLQKIKPIGVVLILIIGTILIKAFSPKTEPDAAPPSAADAVAEEPEAAETESTLTEETEHPAEEEDAAAEPETLMIPEDGLQEDGCIHVYLQGSGERVETPESSFIHYIEYYPDSCHLTINMNGTDYTFANIPAELWEDFKAAGSKGSFYNQVIKNEPDYLIRDYAENPDAVIVVEHIGEL